MTKKKFIVITGPTASGKTAASVQIAKALKSEVIAADSMQVYRGCDIGTAKTTDAEMQGIPHHMLDIIDPDEEYSVAEYQMSTLALIDSINVKGITPIVCGGTGLYINSLVYDLDFSGVSRNDEFRQKYAQLYNDKSTEDLYNILKEADPIYANVISQKDRRRILRRLEIIDSGGGEAYDFRQPNENYDYLMIGLTIPRELLYSRIDSRVDTMIVKGLVNEAGQLYKRYGEVNALKAIGYKELIAHFKGECSLEDAIALIKRNTRRFAKRQMTWFRRDERIEWFDVSQLPCIEDTVNEIIIYIKRKGF